MALQTHGTCWFYTILNGLMTCHDGQLLLAEELAKVKEKLKPAEAAFFYSHIDAPCPLADITKTNKLYFWKFINQYLCHESKRHVARKAGLSAELLRGVPNLNHNINQGAQPQTQLPKILNHIGLTNFVEVDKNDDLFHLKKRPHMVLVFGSLADRKLTLAAWPKPTLKNGKYELACLGLSVQWLKGGGHAMSAHIVNGSLYVMNPQNGAWVKLNALFGSWAGPNGRINDADAQVKAGLEKICGHKIKNWYFRYFIYVNKAHLDSLPPLTCLYKQPNKAPSPAKNVVSLENAKNIMRASKNKAKTLLNLKAKMRPQNWGKLKVPNLKAFTNLKLSPTGRVKLRIRVAPNYNRPTNTPSPKKENPKPRAEKVKIKGTFSNFKNMLMKAPGVTARKKLYSNLNWLSVPVEQRKILQQIRNHGTA